MISYVFSNYVDSVDEAQKVIKIILFIEDITGSPSGDPFDADDIFVDGLGRLYDSVGEPSQKTTRVVIRWNGRMALHSPLTKMPSWTHIAL